MDLFLKKSNVFKIFKVWKVPMENETELRLKFLLPNNGGEFCNKAFGEY